MKKRCDWANPENQLYVTYHDTEWGVPVHDDQTLFEFLILEGAQAGLSWETVLKKRAEYQKVFHNFDIKKVASLSDAQLENILQNPGIIRNRRKVFSARQNAKAVLAIQEDFGSFSKYLWSYVNNKPLINHYQAISDVPTSSPESIHLSKDLKKRGCNFVGPTIMYAFMQAVGVVMDHTTDCFRYQELT